MNTTLNFELVESRHEIPMANNGAILSQSDIDKALTYLNKGKENLFSQILETAAFNRCFNICKANGLTYINYWDEGDDMVPEYLPKDLVINLYVTGFSPALVAVINMCKCNNISLNTYHYNKDTGDYFLYPVCM